MKYLEKRFSVQMPKVTQEEWDRIFGKSEKVAGSPDIAHSTQTAPNAQLAHCRCLLCQSYREDPPLKASQT